MSQKTKKQEDKQEPKLSQYQYEMLGRGMESVVTSGYFSKIKLYKISFTRGLFFGLGSALGATLLVGIVVWVLSLFTEIPFLGRFIESLQNTID